MNEIQIFDVYIDVDVSICYCTKVFVNWLG